MTDKPDTSQKPPMTFSKPSLQDVVASDQTPPKIAGYRIIDKLGEGGMGTVWRAHQASTNRDVALKVTRMQAFGSGSGLARFEREVELTARLEHPNIARVYDSGVHEKVYYYAMELVPGQHLDRYIRTHKSTCRQIGELMCIVCSAVEYAHQHGVIHRDLKPSNILVTEDGQPHILDFGLAKDILSEASQNLSTDGDTMGTLAYMSPEQAAGKLADVSTRSDVYCVGVILYHLLTGTLPHDVNASPYEVLKRIVEANPTRPSRRNRQIDRDLDAIVFKCLEKDPGKRYQSISELAGDLRDWLEGLPVKARSLSPWYVLAKLIARNRVAAAIVCLLAVILLSNGFIGASLLKRARTKERELKVQQRTFETKMREREDLIRQASFGLFLVQWEAGMATARGILDYLPEQSREAKAARFLIDPRSFAEKRRELPEAEIDQEADFWHFIFAEQHFRDNRPKEALLAYQRSRAAMKDDQSSAQFLQGRIQSRVEMLLNQNRSGGASQ